MNDSLQHLLEELVNNFNTTRKVPFYPFCISKETKNKGVMLKAYCKKNNIAFGTLMEEIRRSELLSIVNEEVTYTIVQEGVEKIFKVVTDAAYLLNEQQLKRFIMKDPEENSRILMNSPLSAFAMDIIAEMQSSPSSGEDDIDSKLDAVFGDKVRSDPEPQESDETIIDPKVKAHAAPSINTDIKDIFESEESSSAVSPSGILDVIDDSLGKKDEKEEQSFIPSGFGSGSTGKETAPPVKKEETGEKEEEEEKEPAGKKGKKVKQKKERVPAVKPVKEGKTPKVKPPKKDKPPKERPHKEKKEKAEKSIPSKKKFPIAVLAVIPVLVIAAYFLFLKKPGAAKTPDPMPKAEAPVKESGKETLPETPKEKTVKPAEETKPPEIQPKIIYCVHSGSFLDKTYAEEEIEKLKTAGYSPYIIEADINGKHWYRVRVKRFYERADAEKFIEELKKKGWPEPSLFAEEEK